MLASRCGRKRHEDDLARDGSEDDGASLRRIIADHGNDIARADSGVLQPPDPAMSVLADRVIGNCAALPGQSWRAVEGLESVEQPVRGHDRRYICIGRSQFTYPGLSASCCGSVEAR